MASPLDSTMGIRLVSLFLAAMITGGVKATVICLMICETLHIALFFGGTYRDLIDNFGDFAALAFITWYDWTQLLAGYLSAFIVQMYFAYCIYTLSPKHKIMPIFITILALLQIGGSLYNHSSH
ncbi:hypothetical protein B0H14DRAFT_3516662 [Mycena olivaceomarginata]|nr:hypothetical protein B0H14DRAFT_3516662 [Mycena olivaceomarginata]